MKTSFDEVFIKTYNYIDDVAARIANLKHYYVYIAIGCLLWCVIFTFPWYFKFFREPSPLWIAISNQIDHPLTVWRYPSGSHEEKLAMRLFVPFIAYPVQGMTISIKMLYLFLFQHICGILFFGMLAEKLSEFKSSLVTVLIPLSFAATYIGTAAIWDIEGYFDGFAITLFMAVFFCRRFRIKLLFIFLSFWVDERAVIASPLLVLLCLVDNKASFYDIASMNYNKHKKFIMGYLLVILLYLIARWLLEFAYGLQTPMGQGSKIFSYAWKQWPLIPIGIFTPFKFWIVFYFISCIVLIYQKDILCIFNVVFFMCSFFVAFSVIDFTRSFVYAYPAILANIIIFLRNSSKKTADHIIIIITIFNILFPQLFLMTNIQWMYPVIPHVLLFR